MTQVQIDFDCIMGETDEAICLLIDDEEVWLPKRCCSVDEETNEALVPEELALEKGLI